MIRMEHVNKSFHQFQALNDLSLTVKQGEIYGFIGKNGAGKSTTMNIIAGLSKMDEGTCIVNGMDVTKIKHPHELHIGYLPENPNFQGWLTAYETLELLIVEPKVNAREHIMGLLQWVGLADAKNRRVGGFSRGMKQRLGMACTLVNDPELLIFDEPSSALDPEGRADVLDLILDLKQRGKTVILSTHILSDVERVCDRIGLLKDGHLILEKDLDDWMNEHNNPILDILHDGELKPSVYDHLRRIEHVREVEATRNKIVLYLDDNAHVKAVMQDAVDGEWNIQSISLRKNTLEDLFIKEVNNQ